MTCVLGEAKLAGLAGQAEQLRPMVLSSADEYCVSSSCARNIVMEVGELRGEGGGEREEEEEEERGGRGGGGGGREWGRGEGRGGGRGERKKERGGGGRREGEEGREEGRGWENDIKNVFFF